MIHLQLHNQWPGPFDDPVIDAMLNDIDSHHWNECQAYVSKLVQKFAIDFSPDEKEEIAQNAMLSIVRYLPNFRRKCRLTSWIVRVVQSRIADAGRERKVSNQFQTPHPSDPDEDEEVEGYISKISSQRTAEEEYVIHEEFREALKNLLAYLSSHANTERNIRILEMHIDGFSQKDIARMLNIPVPNVGYVIRSIQRFMREQKRRMPPSSQSPH